MIASARAFLRLACGLLLSACADTTDLTAPSAVASSDAPRLSVEGGGSAPSAEELAQMPSEFAASPTILDYWTNVGFLPAEGRAYGRGFMSYFATNAEQNVALSLQFEHRTIASTEALGENSDWLPANRMLFTTAYLGVSGACGHLAGGTSNHKAWHQFIGGGWKFFSWGTAGRSSGDSAEQPACEPPPPLPPPPSSGGGNSDDEYEGGCELCQQWFYVINYQIVDEWWECNSIPDYYCEGYLMT
jgi:hypothetical protein